jgi:hypothetical protein
MAGGVMQQGIRYLLTAFALTAVAADTFAQQLRDPTRPPSFVAPAGTAAVRESDLVLQTVLISPERRAAMQLMSISESEVQLRGRGESRTLHLFPAVNRRETRPPAAGSAGG